MARHLAGDGVVTTEAFSRVLGSSGFSQTERNRLDKRAKEVNGNDTVEHARLRIGVETKEDFCWGQPVFLKRSGQASLDGMQRTSLPLGWKRRVVSNFDTDTLQFRESKIQKLGSRFRQHDVARLQVPVNHALTMGFVQSVGYFDGESKCLLERKCSFF